MNATPASDVAVPRSFPLSKTKALKVLGAKFRNPGFQNVTTPEDKAVGHERWRVYCIGDYAARVGLVEVAGDPVALPKAAVVAAYRRLGVKADFVIEKGKAMVKFTPIAPPSPEVAASNAAAQALAAKAQREIDAKKNDDPAIDPEHTKPAGP